MSICGIIKESPRPVLLCHAEMKLCQRVSAAAQLMTQQAAEETRMGRAMAGSPQHGAETGQHGDVNGWPSVIHHQPTPTRAR